jgi:predicted Zn-dependent peptidase
MSPKISPKVEELDLQHTSGGIPVIVDRLHWSRSAAMAINISVGSRDEPSGKNGIAHLLEHLLFKGTELRSSKEMSQQIEAAGGEMNGYTSKELTSYYVSTIDETLPTAEALLAEMVRRPLIDKKDIKTEKKVVTQEIKMSEDDPEDYSHELLVRAIWKGNPMANSEGGQIRDVRGMTQSDIRAFFQDFYRPPYLSVVAAGNVDARQVVQWASDNFDDLRSGKRLAKRKSPKYHAGIELFPREGEQAYVAMGLPAVNASHPDRYSYSMVGTMLAAGTSSRLYQKVREENGLVYSIYAQTYPFTDTGIAGIFFSTSSKNAERVMRIIADELRTFKEKGLEEGELARAKHWLKGMIVRRLESAENRMFFLGQTFAQTGRALSSEEVLERIDSVKEDDVSRVAEKLLDRSQLCIALHASKKEGGRIAKNVADLDF